MKPITVIVRILFPLVKLCALAVVQLRNVLSNLARQVTDRLKPVKCEKCTEQFADHSSLDKPVLITHIKATKRHVILLPKKLSIDELKSELKKRSMSTDGNKRQLLTRLEGALTKEG